jgi:hypothetical protein
MAFYVVSFVTVQVKTSAKMAYNLELKVKLEVLGRPASEIKLSVSAQYRLLYDGMLASEDNGSGVESAS